MSIFKCLKKQTEAYNLYKNTDGKKTIKVE